MNNKSAYIIFLMFLIGCSPSKKEAVKYNNFIVAEQIAVSRNIEELNFCFQKSEQSDTLEKAWKKAILQVNISNKKISDLKPFDNNSELKEGTLKLFNIYLTILNNEYSEMIKIYNLPPKLYNKEEEKRWGSLLDSSFFKIHKGINELAPIQEKFAERYNIKLKD